MPPPPQEIACRNGSGIRPTGSRAGGPRGRGCAPELAGQAAEACCRQLRGRGRAQQVRRAPAGGRTLGRHFETTPQAGVVVVITRKRLVVMASGKSGSSGRCTTGVSRASCLWCAGSVPAPSSSRAPAPPCLALGMSASIQNAVVGFGSIFDLVIAVMLPFKFRASRPGPTGIQGAAVHPARARMCFNYDASSGISARVGGSMVVDVVRAFSLATSTST